MPHNAFNSARLNFRFIVWCFHRTTCIVYVLNELLFVLLFRVFYTYTVYSIFHSCEFVPVFSNPAFSTPVVWFYIFQFCVFTPAFLCAWNYCFNIFNIPSILSTDVQSVWLSGLWLWCLFSIRSVCRLVCRLVTETRMTSECWCGTLSLNSRRNIQISSPHLRLHYSQHCHSFAPLCTNVVQLWSEFTHDLHCKLLISEQIWPGVWPPIIFWFWFTSVELWDIIASTR